MKNYPNYNCLKFDTFRELIDKAAKTVNLNTRYFNYG